MKLNRTEFVAAFAARYNRTRKDTDLYLRQFEDFMQFAFENNINLVLSNMFSLGMENWDVENKYVPKLGYVTPPPRLRPFIRLSPSIKKKYTRVNDTGVVLNNGKEIESDEV